jgi:hypothetical protein
VVYRLMPDHGADSDLFDVDVNAMVHRYDPVRPAPAWTWFAEGTRPKTYTMETRWSRWLWSLSEERPPSKRADGRLVPSQTYLDHFEYVRICALSTSLPAMITIFHPQGGA